MTETVRCPKCGSENVFFSKKHGTHVCEDCGHEFTAEKPFAPLRIFLSYGHDSNEELVRRIKADLEQRGHDVWFDKNEIKFGDNWRRSITDGIVGSQRVLSFLSKHSTRDPGVCRDEIAIAIGVRGADIIKAILVEDEREVKSPVSISHIQWLDMHDWKDRRDAGDAAWEPWYQAKLAEIVRVVENEESRRFAGEIETLNGHLKPIKSDARICQLLSKGFYGREWLFEAVEKWRQDTKLGSRLFWIMGAPGVGKSAFAAQLTHAHGDTVIAAQFCEWDKPDHRNAPRVVRSLAFQLATRLPDYRKLLLTLPEIAELDRKDAAELFDYLLANPLRSVIHGGRERYLIVLDALDEAGEAGRNALVEMLARNAQRLPEWLGLVVTSRPEFDVKTPLQALNPFPLDTQSESNRADIRDYLRRELASPLQNRPDADRLVEQILEKSEGVFLYVERFCDDVQRCHLSLDRPEQFPQGLGGIFCQYFQRQFPDLEKFRKDVRPALRAILAAREPLRVAILQRLFNWQEEELRDFIRLLGSLFPVTREAGHEVIKPYHKSLADWMADEPKAGGYFVSAAEGHRMLAELGWKQFERNPQAMDGYSLAWLPSHLRELGDKDHLVSLLRDVRYLMRRLQAASSFEDRYEYISPHRVQDIRESVVELTKAEVSDLQDDEQRMIETERAVLLYKCHEYLRSAGFTGDANQALRDSLRRREQLAASAVTVSDKRNQLGAMVWCYIGLSTSDGPRGPAESKYLRRAETVLQEIEELGIGGPKDADAIARLQGVVSYSLASERPGDRVTLLERALFAYRRARETSPNDRAIEYSLGSIERYLAYARLESGESQAAVAHLHEAETIVADLIEYNPTNAFYVRLDAHLRRLRSRIALLEGDRSTALDRMRNACSRMEEAGARLKNALLQREVAEFKKECECLASSPISQMG